MNPEPEKDLELRQKKLEAELNQTPPPVLPAQQPQNPQLDVSQTIRFNLDRFFNWFKGLPGIGKMILIGIASLFGLAILQAVLKLVAAVISLAILGLLLYLAYRFSSARSTKPKD